MCARRGRCRISATRRLSGSNDGMGLWMMRVGGWRSGEVVVDPSLSRMGKGGKVCLSHSIVHVYSSFLPLDLHAAFENQIRRPLHLYPSSQNPPKTLISTIVTTMFLNPGTGCCYCAPSMPSSTLADRVCFGNVSYTVQKFFLLHVGRDGI